MAAKTNIKKKRNENKKKLNSNAIKNKRATLFLN